jgi:hypothetical protein
LLQQVDGSTEPGDRLFVGPDDLAHPVYNDTFLYYLLPRLVPASYFLEMNPGTADRPGSSLGEDVSSADVLILTSRYDDWTPHEHSPGEVGSIPEGFCPRADCGPWQMLLRCSGP